MNVVSDDIVLPGFEFFSGLEPSRVPVKAMTGSTAEYDHVGARFCTYCDIVAVSH